MRISHDISDLVASLSEAFGRPFALHKLPASFEHRPEIFGQVDETHARHAVFIRLTPHRLRLRFNARHTVETCDCSIEHAQRPLDFDREVHVARRVDDVQAVLVPDRGRRGGRDRDAALLLLLHPVHRGGAVVDLTDLVVDPGVEQDPLGGRGLARVDVRHDPDVADLGEVDGGVGRHGSGSESE